MEQELDLSTLNGQHLDPELFRRVWERVMPDSEHSPLSLSPRTPVPPSVPAQASQMPACLSETSTADIPLLKTLMDQIHADRVSILSLLRNGSQFLRPLTPAAEDCRRGLQQLSTAYFLISGQQYRPKHVVSSSFSSRSLALRDQFHRAKRREGAFTHAAQTASDPCLQELCHKLSQDSAVHAGRIRSLLEQMQPFS